MKSLTESPAILNVHTGSPGQYVIRVSDLRHRPLVIGVTKLLADAQSFVVVTPSDIKVFVAGNGIAAPAQEQGAESGADIEIDAETQAAIDAEEGRAIPGANIPAEMADVGAIEEPV